MKLLTQHSYVHCMWVNNFEDILGGKIMFQVCSQSLFCQCRGYTWNKIIIFQNYFRGLLQLTDIFQHVQCRWNKFEIISVFYFTCKHVISLTPSHTVVVLLPLDLCSLTVLLYFVVSDIYTYLFLAYAVVTCKIQHSTDITVVACCSG